MIVDTVDGTAMYPGHHGEEWGWVCDCCGAPMIMAMGPGLCSSCAQGDDETYGGES